MSPQKQPRKSANCSASLSERTQSSPIGPLSLINARQRISAFRPRNMARTAHHTDSM
jgi:hypothetical protein